MLSEITRTADAAPRGQSGLAELTLERRAGRTRLTRSRTKPPLLVQQALYPDEMVPDMAYVFLANPTGGLLENDCQDIRVSVGPEAKAHVTTQSATKILTMDRGVAKQQVALNVAAGGYLEYVPDPLIPFKNASLVQRTNITVEPGASLVYGDVLTPGRVARGEALQYRRVSNRLTVYREDTHPIYREAFDIVPAAMDIEGIGVLASAGPGDNDDTTAPTLGSMLILCESPYARVILEQARNSLRFSNSVRAGTSLLHDANGVGVRMIAVDCPAVQAAMHCVWSIARRVLLGTDLPSVRKY